jgi:hypothetical protein
MPKFGEANSPDKEQAKQEALAFQVTNCCQRIGNRRMLHNRNNIRYSQHIRIAHNNAYAKII